ncbi:MAG: TRAP transporter small permease [Phycisphaerales bacterium]|nr:MAG: TRAP transporter small permease [Phycisphaerales bacterium]
MTTLHRVYAHLEELAGATLLAGMCIVAVIQVTTRYVLASPPAWTEETATLLFAWLVFVGASLALKRNEHFALDVVVVLLPRSIRRIMQGGVLILVLAFCGLLIGYGVREAIDQWTVRTAVLEIPRTWLYASVPFGGILMLLRTAEAIARWWNPSAMPTVQPDAEGQP